jgi:hypothetical protein
MPDLISSAKNRQSSIAAAEGTWVSLSDQGQPAFFSAARRTLGVSLARQLSVSSPLYSRMMSAILDHVVPSGLGLVSFGEVPDLMAVAIDWLWYSGPSALHRNMRDLVGTLFNDGELLLKPRVNKGDGRLTLTLLDPDDISEIAMGEGFNNVTKVNLGMYGEDEERYNVITKGADGLIEGDVFYMRVLPNTYSSTQRGTPLIIALLDDVASATELTYSRVSRLARVATHYWDVELVGASQDTINNFLTSKYSVPPESGEVFAHNESVNWNFIKGEAGATIEEEVEFFMNFLSGTAGLGPDFIGNMPGRDVTTESLFSALAHLAAIQESVISDFNKIIAYAVQQSSIKIDVPEVRFSITASEAGSRLDQRKSQAFNTYIQGLTSALENQLITPEEAQRSVNMIMMKFGILKSDTGKPFPPYEKPVEEQRSEKLG